MAADMSGGKGALTPPERGPLTPPERDDGAAWALGLRTGWTVVSYLIAGMIAYGGIGWLIGRAAHAAILFPFGMLAGLGISIGYIIHRYGRADLQAPKGADRDR